MNKLTLTGVAMATFLSAIASGGAGPSGTSASEASRADTTSTPAGPAVSGVPANQPVMLVSRRHTSFPSLHAIAPGTNDVMLREGKRPPPMATGVDGFADLGDIALGSGEGGEGVAIAANGGQGGRDDAAATAGPMATATRKAVQPLAPAAADVCSDPPVRVRRRVPVAPTYTMQARQAEIEGVVRVEVTVDESGRVTSARIVSGLGYGLDESAVAAAKASVFEPASLCGKPIVGAIVLPFRFESI